MRAIACTDLFRYPVLRLRRPLRVLRTTCERRTDRVIHLCVDSLRAPHLQMYRVVASYALQSVGGTASLATGAENLCQGVSPYLGLKPLVGRCVEDSVLVRNLGLGLLA